MNKIVLEQSGDNLQMTISADVSRRLGLKAGQEVTLVNSPDGVKLVSDHDEQDRRRAIIDRVLEEQGEALRLLASR